MDSFLDEPRSFPKPTPIVQELNSPTVPEVSLMFQNSKKEKVPEIKTNNIAPSYNAWKLRNFPTSKPENDSFLLANKNNKENINYVRSPILDRNLMSKKQVRFENPVQKNYNVPILTSKQTMLPSNTKYTLDKPKTCEINPLTYLKEVNRCNDETNPHVTENYTTTANNYVVTNAVQTPYAISKPFEKLYTASLPNRELELSFLEPQQKPIEYNRFNNISKPAVYEACSSKYSYIPNSSTSSVTNRSIPKFSDNYSKVILPIQHTLPTLNSDIINKPVELKTQVNTNIEPQQNESISENNLQENEQTTKIKDSANDGPDVSDLLEIIKMQNEQLKLLKNQVEKLVQYNEKAESEKIQVKSDNEPPKSLRPDKNVQIRNDSDNDSDNELQREELQQQSKQNKKISVGLMTSFEVSFKPPLTKKKQRQRNLTPIENISSNDSFIEPPRQSKQKMKQDYLKMNKKDFKPTENMITPDAWNYKKTNETEYSLGSQESLQIPETPESPEHSMHIDMQEYDTDSDDEDSSDTGWTFYQDILGQVNNILENSSPPGCKPERRNGNRNPNNERRATDVTLDHVKFAAIKQLQHDGFLQPKSDQTPYKANEISFAVKQILMKYMPDEGLANAALRNKQDERLNRTDKRNPNDVSVATFKYLQQCNVVTNAPQYYGRNPKSNLKTKNRSTQNDPKILDITTLKQQPKLL